MLFTTAAANVRFPRIPGFSFSLGGAKVNQDLLVGVATRNRLPMTIHDSMIRLSPGNGRGAPAAPERSVGGR
jgi:hypothetical protein